MNKKYILIIASVVLILAVILISTLFLRKTDSTNEVELISGQSNWTQEQHYNYQKSIIDLCDKYLEAATVTNEVFFTDMASKSYSQWQSDLDKAITAWQDLEKMNEDMGSLLDSLNVPKEVSQSKKRFLLSSMVLAAESEIPDLGAVTAIFDSAEHGQKLRTVAEVFGWDARTALYHLKREQNLLTAQAWDKAGDTYQRWETAARAIKDTSKVTVFVGANIITAGGASTAVTLGQGAMLAVGGASLALEVGEDVYISFGRDSDAAMLRNAQDTIKPVTEIVSIMSLQNLGDPNNLFYISDKAAQLSDLSDGALLLIEKRDGKIVFSKKQTKAPVIPDSVKEAIEKKNQNYSNNQQGDQEKDETKAKEQEQTKEQSQEASSEEPPRSVVVPLDIPQGVLYFVGEMDFSDTRQENSWGSTKVIGDVDIELTIDTRDIYGPEENLAKVTGKTTGFYQEYILCDEKNTSYGNYSDEGGYMCIEGSVRDNVKYQVGEWYPKEERNEFDEKLEGRLELINDSFCQYYPSICQDYPYGRVYISSGFIGGFTSENRMRIEGEGWYADRQ